LFHNFWSYKLYTNISKVLSFPKINRNLKNEISKSLNRPAHLATLARGQNQPERRAGKKKSGPVRASAQGRLAQRAEGSGAGRGAWLHGCDVAAAVMPADG
jgi:hypothetical protein